MHETFGSRQKFLTFVRGFSLLTADIVRVAFETVPSSEVLIQLPLKRMSFSCHYTRYEKITTILSCISL